MFEIEKKYIFYKVVYIFSLFDRKVSPIVPPQYNDLIIKPFIFENLNFVIFLMLFH